MYTRDGSKPGAFDAVLAVEGSFKYRPDLDSVPTAEVLMVYLNSTTKTTYGSCPFKTFSPKTIEALLEFLKCAEQDFGDVVFEGGILTPFGPLAPPVSGAESANGLPKGLGEER
jgi:hypothetical protein